VALVYAAKLLTSRSRAKQVQLELSDGSLMIHWPEARRLELASRILPHWPLASHDAWMLGIEQNDVHIHQVRPPCSAAQDDERARILRHNSGRTEPLSCRDREAAADRKLDHNASTGRNGIQHAFGNLSCSSALDHHRCQVCGICACG